MKSVIEHVPNPRADLAAVRRLLKPDGYLYLLTPNIESLEARVYGRYWFALVPGDHLWFFSPYTLKYLLQTTGFEPRWLTTTESYEDVIAAVLFAVRSLLRDGSSSFKLSQPEVMNGCIPPRTLASGLSPNAKYTAQRLLEVSRYLNLPWFFVYSHLLTRASLGACIRGVFQKTPSSNDGAESL
jgi:SAM-dependent methyltransferase